MIEDVEVRDAGRKGKGVFALRSFRTGEFIFRRRHGRVVRAAQIASLSAADRQHLYAMRSGVKVFTWSAIGRDEEITIDYRLNAFGNERSLCLCGAPSCTEWVVNSFFALAPTRQRSYLPYAPVFIRREWRQRARATLI